MARQEILGEGFGAFELRGGLRRAKDFQADGLKGVDHADHQRRFRPDDGQTDVMALGESDQRRDVGGGDRHVFQIGFQRGAGIARRNVDFIRQRRLGGFPGQRVLAPAVADNQNVHQGLHEWRAPERTRQN